MNRDVAGLEEDDDGKEVEEKDRALGWRAAVGWEERRSRINLSATVPCPRRFLSPIACLLTLIEYPARPQQWTDPVCSSGSLLSLFICVHKQLTTQRLKRYLWIDRSKMLRQRKEKYYVLLIVILGALVEWQAKKNQSTGRETCPSATLSTTNPTWTGPRSNRGLRGKKSKTNHLCQRQGLLLLLLLSSHHHHHHIA